VRGLKLHWQILIAMALACIAGTLTGRDAALFGVPYYDAYDFIGALFLNALQMIVVPLIMASIITGVAGMSGGGGLGRLGGKTLAYYLLTSLAAILVGLTLVNAVTPGIINGEPAGQRLGLAEDTASVLEGMQGRGANELAAVFLRMVPPNIIAAAAEGQMLGLIFFSLLFGYFMTRIQPENAALLQRFWQGVFETMMQITLWIIRFAPLGVFGLVARTVSVTGFEAFAPLAAFVATVFLGLAVHALVTLPLVLRFVGGVSPRQHVKAFSPALLTAFSTSSSSATLPLTMECAEKNAGVSNRIASFVLPLGATVNMDGTALYECVAALFIAQAYGIQLGFGAQFSIVVLALLTSVGVAGVPSASLVAILVILNAVGLPVEGVGLILAVDRVLDMCRTAVNVFGDTCGTVVIARTEGETEVLRPAPAAWQA
jgi:Na+/H+-dicarboxylate symporter